MRHRKTDAHIATIRVSVPIDLMRLSTVGEAAEAINGLLAHLPPGSTVEVLNSRFGRVDAAITPKQVLDLLTPREPTHVVAIQTVDVATGEVVETTPIADAMAAIRDQIEPELPDSLRRTA